MARTLRLGLPLTETEEVRASSEGLLDCRDGAGVVHFGIVLRSLARSVSLFLIPSLAFASGSVRQGASEPDASPESSLESCMQAHEDAQLKRENADLVGARDALRECSDSSCPVLIQRDCVSLLSEVQRAVPSVVVDVVIAGERREPEAFWLDGELQSVPREPLELNPGLHQFRVRHTVEGELLDESLEVVVQPSMRRQVIQLELRRAVDEREAGNGGSGSAVDTGRPHRIAGFTMLGVGIATGVTTLGLGVAALQGRTRAQRNCAPFCDGARVGLIRSELLAADILGAVSGALLLSSVVLLAVGYARRPDRGRDRQVARRVHLSPTLGGLQLRW